METGHWEPKSWTSELDGRTSTIDVFVPHPLTGPFQATDIAGMADLERSLIALSHMEALASVAPILTRSEGIASSRIEGLVMSTRRVYEARVRPTDVDDRDARQIVANMELMSEVTHPTGPLTHQHLHRWHALLMEADLRLGPTSGRYRSQQNWIGGRVDTPVGAEFIPPPPEFVAELMDDLIRFTNERTLAPIVQAAVVHAQFETIHPYVDGNGRVGRALIYWVLANRGAIDAIAPPISPVIAESATAYVDGLTTFRRNDPNGWVDIFVGMLNGATGYAAALGKAISDLQASWRQRVSDVRSGAVDHKLVPYLATAPVLDASMIASEFDLTPQAASSALERLEEREIVVFRSLRRGRRGRPAKVYEAAELFDLLDESPRSLIARRT